MTCGSAIYKEYIESVQNFLENAENYFKEKE
jgi:hypothetical protein